ncbi:hypothetical protein L1049_015532 [Liquidambar formosana]|uniref:Uncharacterized protein n=1 Tax=Liquidambar formosana TaxID=63359 RepID=A0AAP0RXZ9_LIQFO
MAQDSKEPCKKEACNIQACLTKNNFDPRNRRNEELTIFILIYKNMEIRCMHPITQSAFAQWEYNLDFDTLRHFWSASPWGEPHGMPRKAIGNYFLSTEAYAADSHRFNGCI